MSLKPSSRGKPPSRGKQRLREFVQSRSSSISRLATPPAGVEDVDSRFQQIHDASTSEEAAVRELQRRVKALTDELENRHLVVQSLQRNYEMIVRVTHEDKQRIAELQTSVGALEEREKSYLEELTRMRGDQSHVEDMKKRIDLAERLKRAADKELSEIKGQLKDMETRHQLLQLTISKLNAESLAFQSERRELDREVADLTNKLNQSKLDIEDEQQKRADLVQQLMAAGQEKSRLNNEIEELLEQIRVLKEKNSLLTHEIADWRGLLDDLTAEKREVTDRIRAVRSNWEQKLSITEDQHREDINHLKELHQQEIENLRRQLDKSAARITAVESELADADERVDQAEKTGALMKERVGILESQISEARSCEDVAVAELDGLRMALKGALEQLEERVVENNELTELVDNLTRDRDVEIAKSVEDFRSQIAELENLRRKDAIRFEELKDKLLQVESREKAELNALRLELKDAQRAKHQLETLMASQNVGAVEERLSNFRESLSALLTTLGKALRSFEVELSCRHCFKICTSPIVVVPCGHAYCHRCWQQLESTHRDVNPCVECRDRPREEIIGTFPSEVIEGLSIKYRHMIDAVARSETQLANLQISSVLL